MDKNKVKQSDWYIEKYGTQSEVSESETASVKVPGLYGINTEVVANQSSVESTFRTYLTETIGLTIEEQVATPEITPRVREERIKPEGKGLTTSFVDVIKTKLSGTTTSTEQLLPFQQKFVNRVLDNDPFESKSKKFFVKIADNTPQLDATDFQDFVAIVIKLPRQAATSLIKSKKVTVNNLVVTDLNYVLKSEDVVRVGLVGHYINNTEGAAIVN
jgi:hypothetical protein